MRRWTRTVAPLVLTACTCLPQSLLAEIFVSSEEGPYRVLAFDDTAAGNAVPLRTIQGPATHFALPVLLAVDATRRHLYVPSHFGNRVGVFSVTASGDAAPLREISGPSTMLDEPSGVALDFVHNELYISNFVSGAGRITVYPRNADGDVSPLRVIEGPSAHLEYLSGIAYDPARGEVFVTCQGKDPGVRVFRRLANGNEAPKRSLGGPATGLQNPYGIVYDAYNDEIVVTDRIGAISSFRHDASGNQAPERRIAGPKADLLETIGIALQGQEIIVANAGAGGHDTTDDTVRIFRRDDDGNVAPVRVLRNGTNSRIDQPTGIAVFNEPMRLQKKRFSVDVSWQTGTGLRGGGVPVSLTPDTGYFWFFAPNNVEAVVKVLGVCYGPHPRFWVFAAGLTNVEVTLTVRDTMFPAQPRVYTNPQGHAFVPIQDTNAFATCP